MSHTPAHMWESLRDRCGYVQAIREYYREQLNDPVIANAVAQVEIAQLALDAKMQKLQDSEPW